MSGLGTISTRSFPTVAALWRAVVATLLALALSSPVPAAAQQNSENTDKELDIRSSVGDLHLGNDADARRVGLPLYPGARLRRDENDNQRVNMGIATEAFGMKLVVAHYESEEAPARVIDYYRDKLKGYGKVLECHTNRRGGQVHAQCDSRQQRSRELTCADDDGPITELKVGTEDNQHVVAVEPADRGKGSTFTLVYVHTRGKPGEI